MPPNLFAHHLNSYNVSTSVYEGPLALLLELIEHSELDITRLALAQVTDQYLAHIRQFPHLAVEEISAFLVIAARLIQIKSEALLPHPPQRETGEEDPGESLARQLIIYKRYKELGNYLAKRENNGLRSYLRLAAPPKLEKVIDLQGISLTDLVRTMGVIIARPEVLKELAQIVFIPPVTIREKIHLISKHLSADRTTSFLSLIEGYGTVLDIVVTFLAILELMKRRIIQVEQNTLFGDIFLQTTSEWDADETFDLEFED